MTEPQRLRPWRLHAALFPNSILTHWVYPLRLLLPSSLVRHRTWIYIDRGQNQIELLYTHQGAPSVLEVQEGSDQEGLRVVLQAVLQEAFRPVAERAYRQAVSQRCPVAGRGMAASLEAVGRRPCVVGGTEACSGARHQGLGAYRLAEGMAAFHSVAWALSKVSIGLYMVAVVGLTASATHEWWWHSTHRRHS